jgi:flagellar biosynthesis/type III secretory pathway protein FliH
MSNGGILDMTQRKHVPKQLRESQKAADANIYSEGFNHGYNMGTQDLENQKQRYQALIDRIREEHKKAEQGDSEFHDGRFALSRELLKMAGELY